MLLQVVLAMLLAGTGAAAVAASSQPAIDAAHSWTCTAARETVQLAAVAHLAATGAPPTSLLDLVRGDLPELVLPGRAVLSDDGLELALDGWTVTLHPDDGTVSARCDRAT